MSSMSCGVCGEPLNYDHVKPKHTGCLYGYHTECVTAQSKDGETFLTFRSSDCASCREVPNVKAGQITEVCPICAIFRKNKNELVDHMKYRHQPQGWCIYCKPPLRFSSQSVLLRHQKDEHKEIISGTTPPLPIKKRSLEEPKTVTLTKSDYQDAYSPQMALTNEPSTNKLTSKLLTTPSIPHRPKRKIDGSLKPVVNPVSETKSRASSGDDEAEASSTKRQSTQSGDPVTKNKKFVKTVTFSLVPGSTKGEKKVTFALEITSDEGMDSRSTTLDRENWKYLMEAAGREDPLHSFNKS